MNKDIQIKRISNDIYQELVESAVDSLTLLDNNGIVVYQNPASIVYFGWEPSELIGQPIFDLVHPDDQQIAIDAFSTLMDGGDFDRITIRLKHKDLSWRTAEVLATPLPDGMVLNTRDVTEKEEMIQRLKKSEELFANAFNASSAIYVISEMDTGVIIDVNNIFETTLGYTRDESIGQNANTLSIWRSSEDQQQYRSKLTAEGRVRAYPARIQCKDGSLRQVLIDGIIMTIDNRSCIFTSAVDITDRIRMEEQLRQSQRMEAVGQMTGGLAHDFNNMLTVILGHVAIARSQVLTEENVHEALNGIHTAAKHGASTIAQLLAFSRKQQLTPSAQNIGQVIDETKQLFSKGLTSQHKLTFTPSPENIVCLVDQGLLENALINLIVNARDAMPRGGEISLFLDKESVGQREAYDMEISPGQYARIQIKDSGEGMSEETQLMAFEPFYTTKPIGEGSGLGLSMVYGFVSQSGGTIRIHSKLGEGSVVTLLLPLLGTQPS